MPKYIYTYAYKVPHYRDFVIEAKNQREARKTAKQALKDGRFENVHGHTDDSPRSNERVFILRKADADDTYQLTLDELTSP